MANVYLQRHCPREWKQQTKRILQLMTALLFVEQWHNFHHNHTELNLMEPGTKIDPFALE